MKKNSPVPPEPTLEALKKKYRFDDTKIAEIFGYKNRGSFVNSTAKPRIDKAIVSFYKIFNPTDHP